MMRMFLAAFFLMVSPVGSIALAGEQGTPMGTIVSGGLRHAFFGDANFGNHLKSEVDSNYNIIARHIDFLCEHAQGYVDQCWISAFHDAVIRGRPLPSEASQGLRHFFLKQIEFGRNVRAIRNLNGSITAHDVLIWCPYNERFTDECYLSVN